MKVIEMTTLGSSERIFMDAETGKLLTPEETKKYLEEQKKKTEYTRLDKLAHEWNSKSKSKVPYEFVEWLKMVL